jgi:hypothetical protein
MVFAFVTGFLFTAFAYLMSKRITYLEMYASSLFTLVFQSLTDYFLEFKFELYGYFETGADFKTLIFTFFIYPPLTIIFLNYFPLKNKFLYILYILVWTITGLVYEYWCVQFGVFQYYKWHIYYSALLYPFIFAIISWNFVFIKKLESKLESKSIN